MLSDRRGREYVRSLWVTLVAAVGLVLGLVVAPAATASSTADAAGDGVSAAAAAGVNDAATGGAAAADPVAYINAQNTGDVIDVSAGDKYTCAVTRAGAAYCWGKNDKGQLGNDSTETSSEPVQVLGVGGVGNLANVKQISAGKDNTCAVTTAASGGNAYCWGKNGQGQLGNDSAGTNSSVPVQVLGVGGVGNLANVKQISVGGSNDNVCAVTTDGAAYCWGGKNLYGEHGNGPSGRSDVPTRVKGGEQGEFLVGVTQIAVGKGYSCVTTTTTTNEGAAYCWGNNKYGQLGNGESGDGVYSDVPVAVTGLSGNANAFQQAKQLTASPVSDFQTSCAVTNDGTTYCWGDNNRGQLGNGIEGGFVSEPVPPGVLLDPSTPLLTEQISYGHLYTCAVSGGGVYCWGLNGSYVLGSDDCAINIACITPLRAHEKVLTQATQVAPGRDHVCAINDGTVYCWGNNDQGQVGKPISPDPVEEPNAVVGAMRVVPNPVEFGTLDAGKSKLKDVTVEHSFPLIDGAVVVDVDIISKPVGFSFAPSSGCTNDPEGRVLTLTDDTECTGVVKFAPKVPGEHGGIVELIPRDYPNAGTQLSSSGFADPGPNPDGAVVKASSGAFGKVDVFTAKVKDIKITNVGDEPLRITGAKVKGDADDEFAANVKDCTQDPVAPGKSCKAKVQFFPRDAGESAALLDLKSNAIGGDTIALSGEGVMPVQETDADGDPIGPGKVRKLRVPDKTVTAKKATAKWKRPKGDVPVTGYETRFKKKKSGNWKKWSSKDPEPNLNGWIDRTFKKLSANTKYKVQVRAVSYEVPGKKSTVGFRTDRKGIPTRPANG